MITDSVDSVSVTLWLALLTEAATIALLRCGLGKTWLRRPVTILVLASAATQGLPGVLLTFPSVAASDIYRSGVAPGFEDDATLLLSAAMLAFTVAYLATRPGHLPQDGAAEPLRMPDWRLCALACAPLTVLTYEGRGSNTLLQTGGGAPLATSLASEFLVILMVLGTAGFVLRHGFFLLALLVQSVLLAAAGERTPVLAAAVALIVLLCRASRRPRTRDLHVATALIVLAVLAISGLRTVQGRSVFYRDTSLQTRLSALGTGVAALQVQNVSGQPVSLPLPTQVAIRLDDDAFTGAILQGEHLGAPRLNAAYAPQSLLLAVPSGLWPSKLGAVPDPAVIETDAFGLPPVNFLPGLAGLYAGFLPMPWLCALLAGLGVLAGWGERWLLRRRTPSRMALLAGAVITAFACQEGLPGMLVDLRTATVVATVVWLAALLKSSLHRSMPLGTLPPTPEM
jgi:hypothetical protein